MENLGPLPLGGSPDFNGLNSSSNSTVRGRLSLSKIPGPIDSPVNLAIIHLGIGKALGAWFGSEPRVAMEKDPELVRALVAMGQILCSKESFEEAAEFFERAISKIQLEEENSLLVLACFGAGVSRICQGRKPEGIQHLKRIAELKVPDNLVDKACYYKGLVMLGRALFGDGEKSEAAKYLRIAATYDPGVNAHLKVCEEG